MGRQVKKCPKKCTRHLFSLKPVHYSAFFSRESQFSYCSRNSKTQPIIPKFNRDGKPYTTAFILAMDQLKLVENDKIYQIEHERFKQLNHEEKSQMITQLIPKPKSKSSFCNVCKLAYDDYRDHISSMIHKQTIKDCEFNQQILKLCRNFSNPLRVCAKIICCDELKSSFQSSQSTTFFENQKQRPPVIQYEEPQLFMQKSTKQNLEGLSFYRSLKSFHTFGQNLEVKVQNGNELNLLHCLTNKDLNDDGFLPQLSNFKVPDQTASPIKTKFQRPIILMGRTFSLDE